MIKTCTISFMLYQNLFMAGVSGISRREKWSTENYESNSKQIKIKKTKKTKPKKKSKQKTKTKKTQKITKKISLS